MEGGLIWGLARRRARGAAWCLAVALACTPLATGVGRAPRAAAAEGLVKVGEFRPFGPDNKMGVQVNSLVDAARRRWLLTSFIDPATGAVGPQRVWLYDLDRLKAVGPPLVLTSFYGVLGGAPIALDDQHGVFFFPTIDGGQGGGSAHIVAIDEKGGGLRLLADYPLGARLDGSVPGSSSAGIGLTPIALTVANGKVYVYAQKEDTTVADTVLLQLDEARLIAGQDAFDWAYQPKQCAWLAHVDAPAQMGFRAQPPAIILGCSVRPNVGVTDVSNADVIELASNASSIREEGYPIAGDFSQGLVAYDPGGGRLMLRRHLPFQLAVFDVPHLRWMQPITFGKGQFNQSGFNPALGRLYAQGSDESGSGSFFFVPEVRTTPPQNGLTMEVRLPRPKDPPPSGQMAVDPPTGRLFFAVYDTPARPSDGVGRLFFEIYRDVRPPLPTALATSDASQVRTVTGEAQGYGARLSWVGGLGGACSNSVPGADCGSAPNPAIGFGSRHITFARALRLRLSDAEASAKAITAHAEGATTTELNAAGVQWPYDPVQCLDFGGKPDHHASAGTSADCDLGGKSVKTASSYAVGGDVHNAPVPTAGTSSSITLDPKRGVVSHVTAFGSVDIAGVLHIGRVTATAETWATGRDGGAGSTYVRTIEDVVVNGTRICLKSCAFTDVVNAINNSTDAISQRAHIYVHAAAPDPDARLRADASGVQGIVERDFWDHQQDLALNEGTDDHVELPALVVTVTQDRTFADHKIYSLAGVDAVSRYPNAIALPAPPADNAASVLGSSLTPPAVADATPVVTLTAPRSGVGSIVHAVTETVKRVVKGLRWALTSPLRDPGLLAVWGFLAAPIYLAARRWALLRAKQETT